MNQNLSHFKDKNEIQIEIEDEDFDDGFGEFEDPKSVQAEKASSG